jgi:U3 small nucleolar ribonucleoprotein protein IMP3
MSMRKLKYHE